MAVISVCLMLFQVEFLCERGADVNRGQRSSSLHYAACFGRPQVAKVTQTHWMEHDSIWELPQRISIVADGLQTFKSSLRSDFLCVCLCVRRLCCVTELTLTWETRTGKLLWTRREREDTVRWWLYCSRLVSEESSTVFFFFSSSPLLTLFLLLLLLVFKHLFYP